MPHSFVCNRIHCVFSTKERRNLIHLDMEARLWKFIASVATDRDMKAIAVGGIENHLHLLLVIPATLPLSKAIQTIKGVSSKWINEKFPEMRGFAWQQGYGAFSVSASQIDATVKYIDHQREHHRKKTFEEEFMMFLKGNAVDYDPRYVFG